MSKFFHFRQNNSGGHFDINDSVTVNVIIEAEDAYEANRIAEDLGIYFGGVDAGLDCECCGDRWYPVYGDGEDNLSDINYIGPSIVYLKNGDKITNKA